MLKHIRLQRCQDRAAQGTDTMEEEEEGEEDGEERFSQLQPLISFQLVFPHEVQMGGFISF